MNNYRFHWISGGHTDSDGASVDEAFTKLGYGVGALKAVDYYEDLTKKQLESTIDRFYVNRPGRSKMVIDFSKGLGQFLKNNHLLECRCRPTSAPNLLFQIQPRTNYRLYKFNNDTCRFDMILWFDSTNARVDPENRQIFRTVREGTEVAYSFEELGLEGDHWCLDQILTAKDYPSTRLP